MCGDTLYNARDFGRNLKQKSHQSTSARIAQNPRRTIYVATRIREKTSRHIHEIRRAENRHSPTRQIHLLSAAEIYIYIDM